MTPQEDRSDRIERAWRAERPDLDPSSIGVVTRIWLLSKVFGAERRRLLAGHDIDPAQMDLLGTLRRRGAPYAATTRDLAASAGVSPGAISQRLSRAEARGWVTRRPGEGRQVDVTLTPRGRDVVDGLAEQIFRYDEELLRGLSAAERRRLADLLRTLALSLPEDSAGGVGDDQPAGSA